MLPYHVGRAKVWRTMLSNAGLDLGWADIKVLAHHSAHVISSF